MPVDSMHPDYEAYQDKWQRCRDVIAGQDAVKEQGVSYLPQPGGMTDTAYANYKLRALFYNATKRTVAGYLGMVFRKEPEIDVPEAVEPYLEDITLGAVPMDLFARDVLKETLSVGRAGILVDVQDESVQEGRRPYAVLYTAESIINWRVRDIGGDEVLTLVVLSESYSEPDPADEYSMSTSKQYRVLSLSYFDKENNVYAKPIYRVRVYREQTDDSGKSALVVIKDYVPRYASGEPLEGIPFTFVGPEGVSASAQDPPLLDLVDVNLSHYRTSADMEWARFYVAFPQVWVSGVNPDIEFRIGGGTVWTIEDPHAQVGTVGGDSENFSGLENALADKKKMMATLGARLLEEQPKDTEAAETVRLRQAGEQASLQTVAACVGMAIRTALRWITKWSGQNDEAVGFKLNSEFVDTHIDPQILGTLVESLQAGQISYETFYANLVRGGIARDGVTAEEERKQIESETPSEAV